MIQFPVVNIAKKDIVSCVIFSCDFLKIVVDILEYQAYNYIKDKGNNKFPISNINQLNFSFKKGVIIMTNKEITQLLTTQQANQKL